MDISAALNAAADLIEPKNAWTKGSFARTEKGHPIGPLEDNAACWCVSGAIQRIEGKSRWGAWNAFDAYTRQRGFRHMADYNDSSNQSEVVEALRRCAKKHEAKK